MNQEEKYQSDYEEIDLMDYIKVLSRKKAMILSLGLIVAVAAGIFSFLTPKIYRIDSLLEMGESGKQPAEVSGQVVGRIQSDVYGILTRGKLGISEEEYLGIKAENPKNTGLIKMTIKSSQVGRAKNILDEIANFIILESEQEIKVQKELIEKNIKSNEEKIKLVESDIEKTKNKIKPIDEDIQRIINKISFAGEEKNNLEAKVDALQKILPYQQDPGTQFALFDTKEKLANKKQEIENFYLSIGSLKSGRENLEIQINGLHNSIEDLNSGINSQKASLNNIGPAKVLKNPTTSASPIKPRPELNIAIGFVLGLFFGVCFAFGKEWLGKANKKP